MFVFCLAMSACVEPTPSFEDEDVAGSTSAIHTNDGAAFPVEATELGTIASGLTFREVMRHTSPGGCTATVVGPYAVMSASHCAAQVQTGNFVGWNDAGATSFQASGAYPNPYLASQNHSTWWVVAYGNLVASGNLQYQWPAQHDQLLLFVPALTPEFLADHDIEPVALTQGTISSPVFDDDTRRVVGVSSGNSQERKWVNAKFRAVGVQNQISQWPQDGAFTLDTDTAGFGSVDGGDSGGPTIGSRMFNWFGSTIEGPRTLLATTQGTSGFLSPIGYTSTIALTPNQQATIRLNRTWARARIEDIDGDGIPRACDSSPAAPGGTNTCPAPTGIPATVRNDTAIGLLECAPGYVPAGLVFRGGTRIDSLSVRCRAISCLGSQATCADEYDSTGSFGGTGGTPVSRVCAQGQAITGFTSSIHANGFVQQMSLFCGVFDVLRSGGTSYWSTGLGGAPAGTPQASSAMQLCGAGRYVSGIVAKSDDRRFLGGYSVVCESAVGLTPYVGGTGGTGTLLTCPEGYVARGLEANADPLHGTNVVGHLGLLCAPRSDMTVPTVSAPTDEWVLHTAYWPSAGNPVVSRYPAMRRPADQVIPQGGAPAVQRTRCGADGALTSITVRGGGMIDRVSSFTCRTNGGATTTFSPEIGGNGGTPTLLQCPASRPFVKGIYARSSARVDGLALECVP